MENRKCILKESIIQVVLRGFLQYSLMLSENTVNQIIVFVLDSCFSMLGDSLGVTHVEIKLSELEEIMPLIIDVAYSNFSLILTHSNDVFSCVRAIFLWPHIQNILTQHFQTLKSKWKTKKTIFSGEIH